MHSHTHIYTQSKQMRIRELARLACVCANVCFCVFADVQRIKRKLLGADASIIIILISSHVMCDCIMRSKCIIYWSELEVKRCFITFARNWILFLVYFLCTHTHTHSHIHIHMWCVMLRARKHNIIELILPLTRNSLYWHIRFSNTNRFSFDELLDGIFPAIK